MKNCYNCEHAIIHNGYVECNKTENKKIIIEIDKADIKCHADKKIERYLYDPFALIRLLNRQTEQYINDCYR